MFLTIAADELHQAWPLAAEVSGSSASDSCQHSVAIGEPGLPTYEEVKRRLTCLGQLPGARAPPWERAGTGHDQVWGARKLSAPPC